VRYGYFAWEGVGGFARYNACIRMIRADYCGDRAPHTRDGNSRRLGDFWVRRVRIWAIYSLEALRAACPRSRPHRSATAAPKPGPRKTRPFCC
jgi:hypothetical protein